MIETVDMVPSQRIEREVFMKKIGLVGGTGPESTMMYYCVCRIYSQKI